MRSEETGKNLESIIESQLIAHNYKKVTIKEMKEILDNNKLIDDSNKYYTKHFPLGVCLFPLLKRYEEFFIYNSPEYPTGLILTAKWQQSTGTVYEKAPYIALNIKYHHPYPTILLWDGDFTKHGVKGGYLWLKERINGKFIAVFKINEFLSWANNGGL